MSDLDALVARLSAVGLARVYKFGAVPPSPSYPYTVLSPAPGAPTVRTLDGHGKPVGRFTAQHFSRTIDPLTDRAQLTFDTFDGEELSGIEGQPVAGNEIWTTPYRDPDTEGVLDVTQTYRF